MSVLQLCRMQYTLCRGRLYARLKLRSYKVQFVKDILYNCFVEIELTRKVYLDGY